MIAVKLDAKTIVNNKVIKVMAPVPRDISELNKKLNIINGRMNIKIDLIIKLIERLNDFNSTGTKSPSNNGRKSTDKISSGNFILANILGFKQSSCVRVITQVYYFFLPFNPFFSIL